MRLRNASKPISADKVVPPTHTEVRPDNRLSRSVPVLRVTGSLRAAVQDEIAVEEPLQIRLAGEDVAVLMRTPGHDDELASGYLYSEGIIRSLDDIEAIRACPTDASMAANVVNVQPRDRQLVRPGEWSRLGEGYSSCGICGTTSIGQVMKRTQPLPEGVVTNYATLYRTVAAVSTAQAAFQDTGGLHAAALFTPRGEMLALREDVGRHNAVDKIIGYALLNGQLPLSCYMMFVTSRASFEVVQKAANAGVTLLAVMSAPSTLAIDLANESGLTLVAFLRTGRFNIYTHSRRLIRK